MGLFSSIFGADALKESNLKSWRAQKDAYGKANEFYDPYYTKTQGALPAYLNAVGLGDSQAGMDAFQNSPLYRLNYNSAIDAGNQGVNAMGNAAGVRNSGATLKALQDRAQKTTNQFYGDYVNPLASVSNIGLQMAGKKADLAMGLADAKTNYLTNKGSITAGQMAGFDGLLGGAFNALGGFSGMGNMFGMGSGGTISGARGMYF